MVDMLHPKKGEEHLVAGMWEPEITVDEGKQIAAELRQIGMKHFVKGNWKHPYHPREAFIRSK